MSSEAGPKLAATKTQILTHMTKDHADSLALMLNHFCRIPTSINPPPSSISLDEITLDHFTISHSSGRNLIKFKPPMTSYAESRQRFVELHKEALRGLDLADFKVEKFVAPNKAYQWFTHAICVITFVTFIFWPAEQFFPESGGWPYQIWSLGGLVPSVARLSGRVKDRVLIGMFVIHLSEAAWFSKMRLRRYWVPRFSWTWWMWVTVAFNGGVAGIWRFEDYVKEIKEKKKKKGEKH